MVVFLNMGKICPAPNALGGDYLATYTGLVSCTNNAKIGGNHGVSLFDYCVLGKGENM